ncbi:COX15/CtaA family protein [Lapillicoccus jejuensis]|uniref:Cytochrome c oxidase assembly protein subunit 15 n=1 Tax=Lapillicoccus jejuensis TaxID=402171 RepID=A0A542E448_9MICO|nr:COX15/CtaA family protein [Lapillicoccus jejuensis]TQJ10123.1 cytochrome c oxidase assembly protein subunit 15 [Lapillicoccus jejuensis]
MDLRATPSDRLVERGAWAALVANAAIVLTGGLVRLTGSGLGCPTWPRCTDESFVAHPQLGIHGAIEFGNRLLTYVLILVVLGTLVVVWRWARTSRSLRWHAGLLLAGIPLQGVIGGISVLTRLNPWVVGLHMILSMVLVSASAWLVLRVRRLTRGAGARAPLAARRLAAASYVVAWVAVWLGTVVTGAGPHAGDLDARRNGLDTQTVSHVHAWSVYLLVALTLATVVVLRRAGGSATRSAVVLLAVELAQGVVGFVQYFTGLPVAVVALHLVGACVLVAAVTWVLVVTHAPQQDVPVVDRDPGRRVGASA